MSVFKDFWSAVSTLFGKCMANVSNLRIYHAGIIMQLTIAGEKLQKTLWRNESQVAHKIACHFD